MNEDFNPYHHWLGLDRGLRNPTPYQLLGLAPGETDPVRISAAADAARNRVCGFRPESRLAEWSRLLAEIDTAKRSLLDSISGKRNVVTPPTAVSSAPAEPRRPAPRAKTGSSPPGALPQPTGTPLQGAEGPTGARVPMASPVQPAGGHTIPRAVPVQPSTAVPAPVHPGAQNSAVPHAGNPSGPGGMGGIPVAVPVAASATPAPVPVRRTKTALRARRSRRSSNVVVLAGTAGALMLVAAIVLLVFVALRTRDDNRGSPRSVAINDSPGVSATPRKLPSSGDLPRRQPPQDREPVSIDSAPRTPTEPTIAPDAVSDRPAETPDISVPGEPTEIPAMFGKDVVGNPPPSASEDDGPQVIPADPDATATRPSGSEMSSDPASSSSSSGLPTLPPFETPGTSPMDPQSVPSRSKPASDGSEPTPRETEQLMRALADARRELTAHRFDEALATLTRVEQLPMLPEQSEKYQRLHLLVQYARNFRTALSEAIGSLQGGDEVPVGTSTVVGVVQTAPDQITVRVAGANRTYAIDDLPVGLAIAIADQHLADSDPISLVTKAAYLASLKDARDDQVSKAREWFQEAKGRGVEIGDLEKVLDDSYEAAP